MTTQLLGIFDEVTLVEYSLVKLHCLGGIVEVYLLQYPNTNLNYLIPNL